MARHVLSIGSCSSDNYRLARVLGEEAGAEMSSVETADEAVKMAAEKKFDLLLVNRINDWDGTPGVEFISTIRRAGVATPVMLISDYTEAQAEAVANGALPGFGKSRLNEPAVGEMLRQALGEKTA